MRRSDQLHTRARDTPPPTRITITITSPVSQQKTPLHMQRDRKNRCTTSCSIAQRTKNREARPGQSCGGGASCIKTLLSKPKAMMAPLFKYLHDTRRFTSTFGNLIIYPERKERRTKEEEEAGAQRKKHPPPLTQARTRPWCTSGDRHHR